MTDDSLNFEVVFTAKAAGIDSITKQIQALNDVVIGLRENELISEAATTAFAEGLMRLEASAIAAEASAKGLIRTQEEIQAIREKYLANEQTIYNQLLFEQDRYDQKVLASAEKVSQAQLAIREKYLADEQTIYNQLLFEQEKYDEKVIASTQKATEAQVAAREKYVADEQGIYNQLLFEQEKHDQKVIASAEKATEAQIAAQEKYLADEQTIYNQLLFEQEKYDAKVIASAEKATEAQIAAREKYVADEQGIYNQLLFEQEKYDAQVAASTQKATEAQIAAREKYVAAEQTIYNQLLFEQQKYDQKVIADRERVAAELVKLDERTQLTRNAVLYSTGNTTERTSAAAEGLTSQIVPAPNASKGQIEVTTAANRRLLQLQQQLTGATSGTKAAVESLAEAYRREVRAQADANGVVSAEKMALAQQRLKEDVDYVTKQYAAQVKEIEAAARATREYAGASAKATTGVRGMGNFYPLILQTAFWAKAGKDLLGFSGAAVKTAAEYQDAFASVSRTTQVTGSNVAGQIEYIRLKLKDLATEVPAGFVDLSKIATMGNEMGIQAAQIIGFTKTVEQYSTVTGTSIENTANALGAIGNILKLPADGYQKLGSAISLTGRLSLASEPEIVTMTEKLAATAHQAGFTTTQIIGLSATLASLKEAPERSQGALEKYFSVVNIAAAEGGPKLDAFAKAIGKSASATKEMIQNNPMEFFKEFLGYISKLKSGDQFSALKDFGLSNVRVSEVIRRLSGDIPLLNRLIGDSNKGYAQGTDLSDQFAKRTMTLAQQFQELQNAVANLLDDLGNAGIIKGLAPVVGILKDIVINVDKFIQKNHGVASVIIALTALAGALALVRAAYVGAVLMASVFQFAEERIEQTSIVGTLGTIAQALFGIDVAGWAAASGLERATIAMRGLVSATIIGAIIYYVISALTDFRGTMIWTADAMGFIEPVVGALVFIFDTLGATVASVAFVIVKAATVISSAFGLISNSGTDMGNHMSDALYKVSNHLGKTATDNKKILDGQLEDFRKWANSLPDTTKGPTPEAPKMDVHAQALADYQKRLNAANKAQQALASGSKGAADGIDGVGAAAQKAVYSLTDYASDLSSTFKRAFDIKFGPSQAYDAITTQFRSMADGAKQARKDIQAAHDTIKQLEADMSKTNADNVQQKYFLGVANQFGDSMRAGEIQGNIDSNNATLGEDHTKLLDAQQQLRDATDKLSTSFTSNTAGAIANRGALYSLYQKYQDYITALAASGADQKTLSAAVKDSKEKFDKQATSLGFNKSAIDKMNTSFDGMITIIGKIPRNITVKANADPAMQAINEFVAKAASKLSSLAKKPINIPAPTFSPSDNNKAIRTSIQAEMVPYIAYLKFAGNSPSLADSATVRRYENRLDYLNAELGMFAEGGYTGPGGKYQPAGTVHKGEYVVPAYMVNQNTGLPYADALGRLISGMPAQGGYASGGYVSGDMMVTELGPRSLGVLRQMVNSEVVAVISAQNVTGAVNATNAANRRRGR